MQNMNNEIKAPSRGLKNPTPWTTRPSQPTYMLTLMKTVTQPGFKPTPASIVGYEKFQRVSIIRLVKLIRIQVVIPNSVTFIDPISVGILKPDRACFAGVPYGCLRSRVSIPANRTLTVFLFSSGISESVIRCCCRFAGWCLFQNDS